MADTAMTKLFGDNIDTSTFSQILEMDESETDRDFSLSLVEGFFEQAAETFNQIDDALKAQDLPKLSSLGHFLKGSSATLGFIKVKDSCQVIQQYGHGLTVDGNPEPDQSACLNMITKALASAKVDVAELKRLLSSFYDSEI